MEDKCALGQGISQEEHTPGDELFELINTSFAVDDGNYYGNQLFTENNELAVLKAEVQNIYREVTAEIDTIKAIINNLKPDIQSILNGIAKYNLEQKKCMQDIEGLKNQLIHQNTETASNFATVVHNLMSPVMQSVQNLELKFSNLEASNETMKAMSNHRFNTMTAEIKKSREENIMIAQSIDELEMRCAKVSTSVDEIKMEVSEMNDDVEMEMRFAIMNNKQMIKESEMEVSMSVDQIKMEVSEMKMEKLRRATHDMVISDSVKNLDKRIELIAFALSTMNNPDAFADAVHALNLVTPAILSSPTTWFTTPRFSRSSRISRFNDFFETLLDDGAHDALVYVIPHETT